LKIIIEQHNYIGSYDQFSIYIDLVNKTMFPDHFKVSLLTKIIMNQQYKTDHDFVIGITVACENTNLFSINRRYGSDYTITNECMLNNTKLYSTYLKTIVNLDICYSLDKLAITQIIINGKPIDLMGHQETNRKGTLGGNTLMSMATHISKISLGLITL